MAAVVGFAFWGQAVTVVGKQVFLRVVATIPNAMLCMTTTAGMVQKAAVGRKKMAAVGGKKTAACVIPTIWRRQIDNKVFFFVPAQAGLFLPPTAAFCICGFSACHQAGADVGGGEYPRARSRDSARHTRTQRAKP